MEFNAVTVVRPYEQIVKQIQQAIRDGRIARGARLPTERELGDTFGVSRSVVREAVKVLDAMGLVEPRQGSGLYVRNDPIQTVSRAFILSVSPDAESVERLFEFRLGLEAEAARFAAERRSEAHVVALRETVEMVERATKSLDWSLFGGADSRFHEVIGEASGNPYLQVAIATARDMQRDVVRLFAEHPGSMEEALAHHRAIFEAIRSRDARQAATMMTRHIAYTAEVVQTPLSRKPAQGDAPSGPHGHAP